MKTRGCDRPTLALLASGTLDASQEVEARRHLQECAACRAVFEEFSAVAAHYAKSARNLSEASLSGGALRRVREHIRQPAAAGERRREFIGAVLVACGWIAAALLLAIVRPGQAPVNGPAKVASGPVGLPAAMGEPSPRLLTYRHALNRSDAEFDRLLSSRGTALSGGAAPGYRAGWPDLDRDL